MPKLNFKVEGSWIVAYIGTKRLFRMLNSKESNKLVKKYEMDQLRKRCNHALG